jgi:hypothetical protein
VLDLFAQLRQDLKQDLKQEIKSSIDAALDEKTADEPSAGDDSGASPSSVGSRSAARSSPPQRALGSREPTAHESDRVDHNPLEHNAARGNPNEHNATHGPNHRLALFGGDDDNASVHPDERLQPTTRQILTGIREGDHRPLPLPYDDDNPYPRARAFRGVAMHYDPVIAGDSQSAKLASELQTADAGLLGSSAKLELRTLIPALSALHDIRSALEQTSGYGENTVILQQANSVDMLLRERLTLLTSVTMGKSAYQAAATFIYNAESSVSSRDTPLSAIILEQASTKAFSRHISAVARAADDTVLPPPKPTSSSSRSTAAGLRRLSLGQRGGNRKSGGISGGESSGGAAAPPPSAPPTGANAKHSGRGFQGGRGFGGHVPP